MQLGFAFTPSMPPERLRPVARAVEAAGLDELWVWEDCFTESAIASAALALGATERITVGIGLMPTPLRNVALAAMELATLERAIPGRLIAGIGHGVLPWMAQVGARVESPVTLLREYAVALRQLLDGQTVTVDGRYVHLERVALGWPPQRHLPLMIGGSGPITVGVAGELGDGFLMGNSNSYDEIRASVARAREHAGRPELPTAYSLIAATGPAAAERVEADLLSWRATADSAAEPFAVIGGDAAAIAGAVRDLDELGITHVVIEVTRDEPDVDGFLAFLGREVLPLLQ